MTDKQKNLGSAVSRHLKDYIVTYVFLVMSVVFVWVSGRGLTDIFSQLMGRLGRNLFIVLSLIIPIVAGMGINFAITIGAMAAQVGILLAMNWELTGIVGILTAAGITVPLGALFGFLIGSLLNKMKGQETIGSLILGYFANGAYQLLFLFIFGKIIPLSGKVTIIGATGVANTLNLTGQAGLYMVLDNLWMLTFSQALYGVSALVALAALVLFFLKKMNQKRMLTLVGIAVVTSLVYTLPPITVTLGSIRIPAATFLIVALLCLFNVGIMRTKLGQRFRAVGQNRAVANAAGINVNRVRVIAIMISTIFAGWGQIIFVQSLGTLQTYSAHEMVGLYAGAAILVGGASINRATNGQAIIGCLLFHLLFVVAQDAGVKLLGDPAIGEYFRVFISYGVIAVALVMHTWRTQKAKSEASSLAQGRTP